MFHKPVIIGIAGGSASGKTSIARKIRESFGDGKAEIIRMDDYYNDQSAMTMEERLKVNYDHPFAFDVDLLIDRGDIRSGFTLGGLYADLRDGFQKDLDMVTVQGADADFLARIRKDEVLLYEQ